LHFFSQTLLEVAARRAVAGIGRRHGRAMVRDDPIDEALDRPQPDALAPE